MQHHHLYKSCTYDPPVTPYGMTASLTQGGLVGTFHKSKIYILPQTHKAITDETEDSYGKRK